MLQRSRTKHRRTEAAGMAILPRPSIYEINTWLWLRELSGRYGESITLASVPAGEWDSLAEYGFDAVWLMGVWERSPLGLELALEVDALQKALTRAVPDWTPADVVGSPYCIRDYIVDPALGGPAGLAAARQELAARGMALILDFVSNHVAPDHAWVTEHPDYFIRGTAGDLAAEPGDYYKTGEVIVALGRDPNFPPWPDVAQLNAFSPELRRAAIDTLRAIAWQCDGVRCDMAMLMTGQVFGRSWGERAGPPPA
ncbi:MAG TPA: alpha-amylase family glycosyl hydrolase, partial [Promineifilum sp.]